MATFQIFEDRENAGEKENQVALGGIKLGVGKPGMEKRTTLATLNNVIDQQNRIEKSVSGNFSLKIKSCDVKMRFKNRVSPKIIT